MINRMDPSKIFFLVDENTHEHCLPGFLQLLEELPELEILEVEAGEDSKSAEVVVQLWEALAALEADRQALMLNLGGGVITDLGGFLAGTYLRGIPFINIPTSLLAMVDASAGGKNGINLAGMKNRVGLFLEPEAVFILPGFLESLPQRERVSGFAEMLKHGLIADAAYWEELQDFDIHKAIPDEAIIRRSVEIKQQVVQEDFRESGLRKILNFGHSVGHALESLSHQTDRPLLHGEAIALGMIVELQLSVKYSGLSQRDADAAAEDIRKIFRGLECKAEPAAVLHLMRGDKKNVQQQLRLSLLKEIGSAVPDVPVDEDGLVEVLAQML